MSTEARWLRLYRLVEQGAVAHPGLIAEADRERGPLGESLLHWAVLGGAAEAIARLVEQGVTLDVQNDLGNTALMEAAAAGRFDVVRVLLAAGADRTICNHDGETLEDYVELYGVELPEDLKD